MPDTKYRIFRITGRDYVRFTAEWFVIDAVVTYVFYESAVAFCIMLLLTFGYIKYRSNMLINRRRKELCMQFREMCISVSSGMAAGASINNALISAYEDMVRLYGNNGMICKELDAIIKGMKMSIPVEKMFEKFADKSGIQDIRMFSEILNIAQRSGGDMIKVMKTTASNIGEKAEVEREIDTIIGSKKYEQMVMNVVPFVIVLYMKVSSPETFGVMYGTVMGVVIMTVCLLAYVAAFIVGRKMTEIEV